MCCKYKAGQDAVPLENVSLAKELFLLLLLLMLLPLLMLLLLKFAGGFNASNACFLALTSFSSRPTRKS